MQLTRYRKKNGGSNPGLVICEKKNKMYCTININAKKTQLNAINWLQKKKKISHKNIFF